MKNPLLLPLLLLVMITTAGAALAATATTASPPRLIVRGDDMGYSHSGNQAIVKCFQEGIERSVEVIVPSPWFPEAVKLLNIHTNVDVGIHLALSSEWDLIKWRPVSDAPSLRDPDGFLFPMIFPNKNYPGRALSENTWRIEDVEREFRAQIQLALKHIPRISHVSHHMGCAMLNGEVRALARRLAREYHIDIEPSEHEVKSVTYVGPSKTPADKLTGFLKMLKGLQAGQTYLFVDHPGLDTPELRAIHHIGYEDVAVDRQGVTDTWTHPQVKEAIRTLGIQLISYRDLVK